MYAESSGKSDHEQKFMNMLLAMEVYSADVYWHMRDDTIYDQPFSLNRMTGSWCYIYIGG